MGVSNQELNKTLYADQAPIKKLTLGEAIKAVQQIKESVNQLEEVSNKNNDQEINRWNERIKSTKEQINIFEKKVKKLDQISNPKGTLACYYVNKEPIGIIYFVYSSDETEIKRLVTHPLSENAGLALIEYCINFSNHCGKIKLYSTPFSRKIYEYLGFTGTHPFSCLYLDPSTQQKLWFKGEDEKWHFNSNINKKFITDFGVKDQENKETAETISQSSLLKR